MLGQELRACKIMFSTESGANFIHSFICATTKCGRIAATRTAHICVDPESMQ